MRSWIESSTYVSIRMVDSTLWSENQQGVGAEIDQSEVAGVLSNLERQYDRVLVVLGCHHSSVTLIYSQIWRSHASDLYYPLNPIPRSDTITTRQPHPPLLPPLPHLQPQEHL
jgi:hypothetical protein